MQALGHAIVDRILFRPRPIELAHNPYDRSAREALAETLFDTLDNEQPLGTVGRGRLLLKIIEQGHPTQKLAAAYFQNLQLLLKDRTRRSVPGRVLLGLGTGRSGSTSLTALFATVDDSCCTHENPPLIYWVPEKEQVQFHMKRFALLADYFSFVSDVSHWWLNALDSFFENFPDSKVVGVYRDIDTCTKSFMRIKRYGRQSWNHWVPFGTGVWSSHSWDPTYPTYPIAGRPLNPDRTKYELIARYVRAYNERLARLASERPNQVLLIKTEQLSEPHTQMELFNFAGVRGRIAEFKLNVRSVSDGIATVYKF